MAIDVAEIVIAHKLLPGGAYRLPTIGVRNPGSERASYRLGISYVAGQQGSPAPESWFRFSPQTLTLRPGETGRVKMRIALPTGAGPGSYQALVGPQIVPSEDGAQVGAAVAARLTFTVEPSSTLAAWRLKATTFVSDHAPTSWIVPLVAVLGLIGWQLQRRFTLNLSRRVESRQS